MSDRVAVNDVHVLAERDRGVLCVIHDYVMWVPREELRSATPAVGDTGEVAVSCWYADLYRLGGPCGAGGEAVARA